MNVDFRPSTIRRALQSECTYDFLRLPHVRGRGETKCRDLAKDAKKLRVNRVTLWRVVTGRWQSRSLMRRYRELKGVGK